MEVTSSAAPRKQKPASCNKGNLLQPRALSLSLCPSRTVWPSPLLLDAAVVVKCNVILLIKGITMRKGKIQNKECNIRQQVNVITDSVTFTAWKSAKILHWEKLVSLLFKNAWLQVQNHTLSFLNMLNWVNKNVLSLFLLYTKRINFFPNTFFYHQ